ARARRPVDGDHGLSPTGHATGLTIRTTLASSELGARLPDALEGGFDGAMVARGEQTLETVEGLAEHAQRLAEGLALLLEDFPPDDGIGGRDARGVLEATRRHFEEARIH